MTSHAASVSLPPARARGDRSLPTRLLLGARTDAAWARAALWALLALTALLYLWNLSASGWANSFYAAAVQAGSENWTAWFFGSLDASNAITVDKPPASLWIMGLSARLFGFSSWSLLVPQALEGVASVALVVATVRRALASHGPRMSAAGGLLAGVALAVTPAAALMFRFDNPDALLVLLMTAGAYCTLRAVPASTGRRAMAWLALAGVALGFAFLTKMLQGLLVLPAFALAYLLFAHTSWVKRVLHLLVAGAALIVSAGWWVLAVALWPASARPYVGGSTDNTVLDLVFGYNGFARLTGGSGNGGGMGGNGAAGSSFGGATGITRLFSSEMGLEISWLLPAALIALVLGLVVARDRLVRAALVVMGGWLVVTGIVFSFMSGTVHPYYTVALAPAIGGLVGLGGIVLWRARARWVGRIGLAAMVLASAGWGFELLAETPDWLPWLRWVVLAAGLLATLAVLAAGLARYAEVQDAVARRVTAVAITVGLLAGLAGPLAYAIATASVAHTGSIPSVGSASVSDGGAGGFGGTGGGMGGAIGGTATDGSAADGSAATSSSDIVALLQSADSRWAAAIDGSQSAASLELESDTAIMAIGGWSSDPYPTLAQFEQYVADGDIAYYIASGSGGGMGGGGSTASAIASWVEENFTSTTVGGYTVYDLSAAGA